MTDRDDPAVGQEDEDELLLDLLITIIRILQN